MNQDERRAWLQKAMETANRRPADLARALGLDKSRVSRMLNPPPGEKARLITDDDLRKVTVAWGLPSPDNEALQRRSIAGGVPVVGRINERAWVADNDSDSADVEPRRVAGVIHEHYPISDQAAYEIDAPGLPGEIFQPGDIVLTVPFASYRPQPRVRDLIVVRRRRDDLVNYCLRRAMLRDGKVELVPVLQGATDDSAGDELLGLVVGFMRYDI